MIADKKNQRRQGRPGRRRRQRNISNRLPLFKVRFAISYLKHASGIDGRTVETGQICLLTIC